MPRSASTLSTRELPRHFCVHGIVVDLIEVYVRRARTFVARTLAANFTYGEPFLVATSRRPTSNIQSAELRLSLAELVHCMCLSPSVALVLALSCMCCFAFAVAYVAGVPRPNGYIIHVDRLRRFAFALYRRRPAAKRVRNSCRLASLSQSRVLHRVLGWRLPGGGDPHLDC